MHEENSSLKVSADFEDRRVGQVRQTYFQPLL